MITAGYSEREGKKKKMREIGGLTSTYAQSSQQQKPPFEWNPLFFDQRLFKRACLDPASIGCI